MIYCSRHITVSRHVSMLRIGRVLFICHDAVNNICRQLSIHMAHSHVLVGAAGKWIQKSCISNIRVGLGSRGVLMVIGACSSALATTTKTTAPTATATAAED